MDLKIDEERWKNQDIWKETGIYVRAKTPGEKWEPVDIVFLDNASLFFWLRSRGGKNEWAEATCALLLGHSTFASWDYPFGKIKEKGTEVPLLQDK